MQFRLLGPVEIEDAGRTLRLARRRERCLLGVLLLELNRVVSVDRLTDLLWDGEPPDRSRRTIHSHVSRIRAVLTSSSGSDGVDGPADLSSVGDGYRITADPQAVDAHRFQWLLDRAASTTDPANRIDELRVALSLWRGPPLDNAAPAQLRERLCVNLEERRLIAIEDLASACLALRREREILPDLAQAARAHPGRESLIELHMQALYQAGRKVDALDVYGRARAYLADELGLDPSPKLDELHQAILRGRYPEPAPAPNVASDAIPGGPPPTELTVSEPAPTPPPAVVPRQLPADVAPFAGRAPQLHQLDSLLSGPHPGPLPGPAPEGLPGCSAATVVISAIDGMAGVGKTALAVHWGHRVQDRFGDGQLFADLRGFANGPPLAPVQILARFLYALGVPAGNVPTDVEEASAMYRSLLAQKRVLVVLDNVASADQVRPLLPGAGSCMVVVTSRNHLGGLVAREGAQQVALGAMTEADAISLLTRLLGVDRVQAAPAAVAEIAEGCGYLPLALRIAAANLRRRPYLSLPAYAIELRGYGRLANLEVPGDARATVRAAFGLSYVRLVEPARRMLRLLGLVPGPDFTVPVAAALADTTRDAAGRLLEVLVAANLVVENAEGRFALHDLVTAYAAERCEHEEMDAARWAARDRLYAYLLRHTSAAVDLLYPHLLRLPTEPGVSTTNPFDRHGAALAWLDQERANLVAAVTDADARGAHVTASRLADALRGYLLMRMHIVDGLAVATVALRSAQAGDDLSARAMAHLSHASCLWRLDRTADAIDHLARALAFSRSAGWPQCQSAVLGNLGVLFAEEGRHDEAIDHFQQALALHGRTGRHQGQATVLGNLANLYVELGRLEEAAEHARRAQTVNAELGSRDGQAANLVVFAEVDRLSGNLHAAADAARKALDLYRSIGNRTGECDALRALSNTASDRGEYAPAHRLATAAGALGRDIGNVRLEADALAAAATARLYQGDVAGAAGDYQRAAELGSESNEYRVTAVLIGLATACTLAGETPSAVRWADEAIARAGRAGFRLLEACALTAMAEIEVREDHARQAIEYAERALALHSETGHRPGQAKTYLVLSHAQQRDGDTAAAAESRHYAEALYADLQMPEPGRPPGTAEPPAEERP